MIFDEVNATGIRLTKTAYLAKFFDEVNHPGGTIGMRQTRSGNVLINGSFDETQSLN